MEFKPSDQITTELNDYLRDQSLLNLNLAGMLMVLYQHPLIANHQIKLKMDRPIGKQIPYFKNELFISEPQLHLNYYEIGITKTGELTPESQRTLDHSIRTLNNAFIQYTPNSCLLDLFLAYSVSQTVKGEMITKLRNFRQRNPHQVIKHYFPEQVSEKSYYSPKTNFKLHNGQTYVHGRFMEKTFRLVQQTLPDCLETPKTENLWLEF